jgi:hypothetical protein
MRLTADLVEAQTQAHARRLDHVCMYVRYCFRMEGFIRVDDDNVVGVEKGVEVRGT